MSKLSSKFLHGKDNHFFNQQDSGFTMLELLVVIFMIGILAAIVAPSWLSFVQRQRLNKASDIVLSALQDAQREAKKNKLSYSVSFTTESNTPKIAIYRADSVPDNNWESLTQRLGTDAGEILIGTNLSNKNTASDTVSYGAYNSSTPQTITFDYMGSLANADFGTHGLRVFVAIPDAANPSSPSNNKRCIIVETLIGGMRTAKDNECNLS